MEIDGRLLIELKTDPLGLLLTTPEEKRYFLGLGPEAAQSLALALLAQPGVGAELKSELAEPIGAEVERLAQTDAEFLKCMGVADAS